MRNRLITIVKDPVKLLIILQLTVVLIWWRMWKLPEGNFYTSWQYLSSRELNILLKITNVFLSVFGLFYVFYNRKFALPMYSIFITIIFLLNGLFFHHDMFTVAVLFILIYVEEKSPYKLINSFAASVMIMATFSKINSSFISGEIIGTLLPLENPEVLKLLSISVLFFEGALALYYWGIINNKYFKFAFISFHFFMGLILMRGLVFNALFVYLIERKSNDNKNRIEIGDYLFTKVYFMIAFSTISYRIIISQL